MICVQLNGGLGNQMFQYACGRALATKHRTGLLLDCTVLQDKTPRSNFTIRDYELNVLAINAKQASKKELKKYWPPFYYRVYRYLRNLCGLPVLINSAYIVEQQTFFNNLVIENASEDCFLIGYWQSEQYFKPIEKLIRQEFLFKYPLDQVNKKIADKISSVNSVSLHVRRGDYVNTPQFSNSNNGLCSLEYYQNGIALISQKVVNPVFFVFSDDIEWVKANIVMPEHLEIISGNAGKQSFIDMQLMSLCRHNIIANSSFSWWGAWLNCNSDKIVVAPKQWFADETKNELSKDTIPEEWIRI